MQSHFYCYEFTFKLYKQTQINYTLAYQFKTNFHCAVGTLCKQLCKFPQRKLPLSSVATLKSYGAKKNNMAAPLMTVLGIQSTEMEKCEMRAIDMAQFAGTMAHSTMAIISVAVQSNLQN